MAETTRRHFLKASSLAAAVGTGLISKISSGAYAEGSDVIKIGLVGTGGRGNGAAVQALRTAGKVKLVAIGDAFGEKLDSSLNAIKHAVKDVGDAEVAVDDDHKFAGFDAYKKVIDSDIDLVILATPPGFRPQHFEYAIEKNRHVFMEKPVAVDAPGVRRVLDAARVAKEKNRKVGVGLQRHHQPCYHDLVKRIHDGEIGDVRALRVYWNGGGVWDPRKTREQCKSEMEYQMHNWYYYNWLCGDHIAEQHIHNLDVGNWIMKGYPVKAHGMGGRQVRIDPKYGEIYDHHAVEFTYEDGTVMFSQCRHIPNCWNSVTEHVHGEKGIAHLGSSPRENSIEWFDGNQYQYKGSGADPYQIEHDVLFDAIRSNKEFNEAENGALSTMTSILGRMCTYSGKELTFKEALERGTALVPEGDLTWETTPPVVPDANGHYPIAVPGMTNVLI